MKLTIAFNEDAPISSLAELKDNADLFDNRIVGIEPGAGLTKATTERVIPAYGLDDMHYVTSSTAAMLTELTSATDFPQAAEWIGNYTMDLDQLYSLEKSMFVDYDGQDFEPIVEKWISGNRDYVDSLTL
ncbi:glycine betaine ABC transporter substrate-binding protein [Agreia sp. COWG]|uniref:glycine betaine ABC transporter substrate-binding protein n=1 Tax=Agreia sp. COWG TaxID=2773266 RepID=UPI001AF9F750|nr:glycine betaine ABC transporter substrate-binding protein [Agreia sp. COWG]CAD5997255.1 protein of unknown function [Agreia sp. COWG]